MVPLLLKNLLSHTYRSLISIYVVDKLKYGKFIPILSIILIVELNCDK